MIADVIGAFVFDVLMAPAEWLAERLWRAHRKEPLWWRVISAIALSLATALIFLVWVAILIGIPVGIYLLVTQSG